MKIKKKAFELYLTSLNLGNKLSALNLGICYETAEGVDKDLKEVEKFYLIAADYYNETALINLGNMYENKNGVGGDYSKAIEFYRKAASVGSIEGMCRLGKCYRHGHGVEEDPYEAFKLYRCSYQKSGDVEIGKILDDIINEHPIVLWKMKDEADRVPGWRFRTL